jgi:putative FmdB family regulatory protein
MANYEYECKTCGVRTTLEQSIHEPTKASINCECGNNAQRVFNTFGAIFNGGGWGGKP